MNKVKLNLSSVHAFVLSLRQAYTNYVFADRSMLQKIEHFDYLLKCETLEDAFRELRSTYCVEWQCTYKEKGLNYGELLTCCNCDDINGNCICMNLEFWRMWDLCIEDSREMYNLIFEEE